MPSDNNSNNANLLLPQRNVTFAVNYEVSMWEKTARFNRQDLVGNSSAEPISNAATSGATQSTAGMKTVDNGTGMEKTAVDDETKKTMSKTMSNPVDSRSASDEESTGSCKENKKHVTFKTPTTENQKRRSAREVKKRQVPMERTRVRYDMEMVPAIKRNRSFLDKFPLWATPSRTREEQIRALRYRQHTIIKERQDALKQEQLKKLNLQQQQQKDFKSSAAANQADQASLSVTAQQESQGAIMRSGIGGVEVEMHNPVDASMQYPASDASPELIDDEEVMMPFGEDSSVVWVPKKRQEWEDSVLEMTAVCTSAALRRYNANRGKSSSSKPFHAPLSKEYIRDRIDIDDPLHGYQIRHKTGGWLQGFILWTNFTTWTHYFKWDSSHAMSGIPTMSNNVNSTAVVDSDGSLAQELERQPRSGDPFEGGVVFEAVAEISLVGGLGCGEYLLRMALESIRLKRKYKFVVLQATDSSKTFYERFGFVRVGAICRYERKESKPGSKPGTPIMGYRHWTHPNESDSSLQKHGGPSYMMCLRMPEDDPDDIIQTPFLDEMMKLEVAQKPMIQPLGGGATPYPKRRGSADSTSSVATLDSPVASINSKRKPIKGRRIGSGSPRTPQDSLVPSVSMTGKPPVLPILRGSSVAYSPAKNVSNPAKKPAGETPLSSATTKRPAEEPSSAVSAVKRRRVGASVETPGTAKRVGLSRRSSRDRSKATPTQKSSSSAASPKPQNLKIGDKPKKAPSKRTTERRNSEQLSASAATAAESVDSPARTGLMKQKVKSYPRDRVHFYNKVVRPKRGKKGDNYFVLHYDEPKSTIRIIPMEPRGILSGKRAGRPRWQAVMTNVERDAKTVNCADFDIVKSFMVMKTPVVASEAWDVLDVINP